MTWQTRDEGQMPDEAWRSRVAEWPPEGSARGWARVLVDQTTDETPRDVLRVADDHAGQLAWRTGGLQMLTTRHRLPR